MSQPQPAPSNQTFPIVLGMLLIASVLGWAAWKWWPHTKEHSASPESAAGSNRQPPEKPSPPPLGYVGSQICRSCHAEISDQYQGHSMARSFGAAGEVEMPVGDSIEDRFTKGGCEYRVEVADDGVYHYESYRDDAGELYSQKVEVQYAVGSGQRGRSYFIDRGGVMFMSPISWYSGQNRWDLSPGYPERNHLRFERPVSGRCLGCHAGRVNPEPGENDRFGHPAIREMMISCERCHGPGKTHVEWHRNPEKRAGTDPIVNPAKLAPSKRESVCNQCHLQGADEVRRYGRTDFDFRPGMDLGDIWTVFVVGTGVASTGETTAVSQVQQMHSSRCYVESAGKLGCISCHNPHQLPTAADRKSSYNSKCQSCHSTKGCREDESRRLAAPFAGSCIDCHMPRLGANDVPHTTQTDHRIQRKPTANQRAELVEGAETESNSTLRIFDLEAVPLDEFSENRARGILEATRAESAQDKDRAAKAVELLTPIGEADPLDAAVADALGISLALSGNEEKAILVWRGALQANTKNESLLYSLGLAYFSSGQHQEAMQYFDRLAMVNPWRSDYQGQRARVLLALGKTKEAIDSAKIASQLNPSMPIVYEWLAFAYEQSGDSTAAEHYRKLLKRVEQK